jgi:putative radical SAM enzyme (TIGR03279 family)
LSEANNIDSRGGIIASVEPGSPAASAGLQPGDSLLSLDGHPLRDIIDYSYELEEADQQVVFARDGRKEIATFANKPGVDPGIEFAEAIFDQVRTCRCNCLFCFVDQLPLGLRDTLYLKDDDFRLSFLYGNFITLDNLSADDEERILSQRLSPLRVSVHATDAAVRAAVMGCSPAVAARGLDVLRRLGADGIEFHAQIVLCPGINDGEVLAATVTNLAHDYAGIASVGIVPVAVATEFEGKRPRAGDCPPLRALTPDDCHKIIDDVNAWQPPFRRERGNGFVYAADEFYLRAGLPLPPLDAYDDFPQYENGIGIAASFVREGPDAIEGFLKQLRQMYKFYRVFLLTGTLAAGLVREVSERVSSAMSLDIRPLVAGNRLFGPHVTVTGLLGGADIRDAVRAAGLGRGDVLLIPVSVLNSAADPRFLDGLTPTDIEQAAGCVVAVV